VHFPVLCRFRIIIKNLLLGYFHTPPSKRHEALQVIGHVLSYSRDEMKEVPHVILRICEHILQIKFSELYTYLDLVPPVLVGTLVDEIPPSLVIIDYSLCFSPRHVHVL